MRVGLGHDLHRLVPGRKLLLGGVEIEFDKGPLGHSDGDVLLHAIIDALLGAAGLGDIGEWFPDTGEQWKDADSSRLLTETVSTIHENGWQVANLDCTIAAEQPKLSGYKPRIRENLAQLLQVSVEAVNVKAKTGEGVGPIGRGEAIAADAVALLIRGESREQTA